MKITGQILKENRERRGVTLNEVSLSTKITIKTLTAIEDGNPMNLPPKTFLRGFVRSYAIFLGLDPDEILKTFQEEMGSTVLRPAGVKDDAGEPSTGEDGRADANSKLAEMNSAATEAVSTTETPAVSPEKRGHSKDVERILRNEPTALSRAMIVGGIIALIAIIVFLMDKMESYEAERVTGPADPSSVETAAPGAEPEHLTEKTSDTETADGGDSSSTATAEAVLPAPTPAPTPTPQATAVPTPTPAPTPTPTPVPTATPKPTATPTPTPTPTPKPTTTPTPKPSPSPTATPRPSPTATPLATATPAPSATPAAATATGRNNEILIEALDNVDIEAVIDGETARPLKLKAEQVQTIKAKRRVTLRLSNGGAVNIVVNGIDRGVPGDLGKPLKVDLP